jgi:hypothetical protein
VSMLNKVIELEPRERAFQVFHRRLKVSRQDYLADSNFPQPFSEEGYQDFIARYLEANGDNGVVGMVRVENLEDELVLDAAVRYPVEPEEQIRRQLP